MKSKKSSYFSCQVIQRILITAFSVVLFTSMLTSCSIMNAPRYEETECQFFTESSREIECGILTVPEDRGKDDSPIIELHFAVVRSTNPDKAPYPVFVL